MTFFTQSTGTMDSKKAYPRTQWCFLITLGILWIQSVNFVEGQDPLKIYENLRDLYKGKKADIISDCDVADTIKEGADDEHHGWGTLTTLEYLSLTDTSKSDRTLTHGEVANDVAKLRVFLARVGYLKVPGSLVFLNKQTETLRLEGCKGNVIWRMQGERGMDKEFHKEGRQLKTQAPNSANYIHKITCITLGKCSHTFYVITRPLPDLPQSVQLRENVGMEKDDYLLNCGVPYCTIKDCKIGKTDVDASRRSYPPYKIWWSVLNRDSDNDKIYQGSIKDNKWPKGIIKQDETKPEKQKDPGYKMKVIWEKKIRREKDLSETDKASYETAKDEHWKDAFGDDMSKSKTDDSYSFNSRIIFEEPDREKISGPYECIIQDANGVVSTPSVFLAGSRDWIDYRGRVNVFVISSLYLIVCVGVSAACIVLVAIIILICPKKMEYDDGTRYTKDELVAPAKKQDTMEAENIGAPAPQEVSTNASKKSMKTENSSMKQHDE